MVRRIISPQGVLLFVTLLWASTFSVADEILHSTPPLLYLTARFVPAALVMLCYTFFYPDSNHNISMKQQRKHSLFADTLYLSVLQTFALLLQVWGQKFIPPARSAFLTAVSVPLVPILGWLIYRKRPTYFQLIAAFLGLLGQMLITYPIGQDFSWNIGDLLTFASAILIALIILETSRRVPHHPIKQFASLQTLFMAIFYALLLAIVFLRPSVFPSALLEFELAPMISSTRIWMLILYMGIVCTVFTFFLQTWSMSKLNPTQAAIILAIEPVFAAAIEFVMKGKIKWNGMYATFGAVLICSALIISEFRPASLPKESIEPSGPVS